MKASVRILVILLITVAAVIALDQWYHPWEEKLSGNGLFQFENLYEETGQNGDAQNGNGQNGNGQNGNGQNGDAQNGTGQIGTYDKIDRMKLRIYELFFAPSSNSILSSIAQWILTPIKDVGASISAAMTYAGLFDSSDLDPMHWGLCLAAYFLLFYLFTFLKVRALSAATERIFVPEEESRLLLQKAISWFVPYSIETIFNFLFLFSVYWTMEFLYWIHNGPVYRFYYGCINSSSALVMLPSLAVMFLVLIFLLLLIIAGIISVIAYYALIALPFFLVSLLPWTPLSVWLCVILEVAVMIKLFPPLHEHFDLWRVMGIITWPIRRIVDIFL